MIAISSLIIAISVCAVCVAHIINDTRRTNSSIRFSEQSEKWYSYIDKIAGDKSENTDK